MSYPGVIKYYGGKQGFTDYISRMRAVNQSPFSEERDKLELIQMLPDDGEWQCVVKRIHHTHIDGKKARIISYMVGQSKDDARSWNHFDVSYNSVENVICFMPDIFDTLAIPDRQIIFDKEEVARQ